MVQRVGFFGTLVCASIPNPLFDLADKTWFPFGPSFGATLIGKAKIHIQKLFVIITFSRHIVEQMVSLIGMNWLLWVFEKVIVVMVCFFVCSIVNSTAQSYAKRQQQQKYYEGKTK